MLWWQVKLNEFIFNQNQKVMTQFFDGLWNYVSPVLAWLVISVNETCYTCILSLVFCYNSYSYNFLNCFYSTPVDLLIKGNVYAWYYYYIFLNDVRKCFYFVEFYLKNAPSKLKTFARIFGHHHTSGNCVQYWKMWYCQKRQ